MKESPHFRNFRRKVSKLLESAARIKEDVKIDRLDLDEECKGCNEVTFASGEIICGSFMPPKYFKDGQKIECPCKKCLVKLTCVQPCVEYEEYFTFYHDELCRE